jgi:hypothetical protein
MSITPLRKTTPDEATTLILQGKPIRDSHIIGEFRIDYKKERQEGLHIENCIIDNLVSPAVEFHGPVNLINSRFCKSLLVGAYFLSGLTIDKCIFETYTDFDAGGHNEIPNAFRIVNSQFLDFVNFFDCWFKNDVIIMDNEFAKGTNLLGNKGEPFRVQFDVEPRIENNKGRIDLDGEGDKIVNTIVLI